MLSSALYHQIADGYTPPRLTNNVQLSEYRIRLRIQGEFAVAPTHTCPGSVGRV